MIKTLEINNFKSIKHIKLDCKRINVLIGKPNTGKSNILESFGVFSYIALGGDFRQFVRFERMSNLFYDENLDERVQVQPDASSFKLAFKDRTFLGEITHAGTASPFAGDYTNIHSYTHRGDLAAFKVYKFAVQNEFPRPESDFLLPPSGANLMSLILAHKELRALMRDMFAPFGLEPNLRPQENKIEVIKRLEDITVSYPYSLVSDTLQRTIFHLIAVLSNKDSVITFEEPESHAFPYYTKHLAETIALDEKNNQYFMSTHNPYFLMPLIEKSAKDDIAIFITYFEDYQTKVKPLTLEQIEETFEIDVFSNIDRFLEQK